MPIVMLISTHAPRVGSDTRRSRTRSMFSNFNSRSPCGERPVYAANVYKVCYFNSRSPCGERPSRLTCMLPVMKFQLTLPVWGATVHETLMTAPPF